MDGLPTDRQVLKCIYKMYQGDFIKATTGELQTPGRKTYVPIDIDAVAAKLGCNPYILFGRLYFHLDFKHRYEQGDGSQVNLFLANAGDLRHAVNFAYLAAILAGHEQEYRRLLISIGLSTVALAISIFSLLWKH